MENLLKFKHFLIGLIFFIIIQFSSSTLTRETNISLEIPEFAVQGENITITCEYDHIQIEGHYFAVTFWKFSSYFMKIKFYKEDNNYGTPYALTTMNNVHLIEKDSSKIKILLTNVNENDSGEYSCTLFVFGDKIYNSTKKTLTISDFENNFDTNWRNHDYQLETEISPKIFTVYRGDNVEDNEIYSTSIDSTRNINKLWSLFEMQGNIIEESQQNKQPIIQFNFPGQITIQNIYINTNKNLEEENFGDAKISRDYLLERMRPKYPNTKIFGEYLKNKNENPMHSYNFNEWNFKDVKQQLPFEYYRQGSESLKDFTDSKASNEARSYEKSSLGEFTESTNSKILNLVNTESKIHLSFGQSEKENYDWEEPHNFDEVTSNIKSSLEDSTQSKDINEWYSKDIWMKSTELNDSDESNSSNDAHHNEIKSSEDSTQSKESSEWNLYELLRNSIELNNSDEAHAKEKSFSKPFSSTDDWNSDELNNSNEDSNDTSSKNKSVSQDLTESNDSNEWNSDEVLKDSTKLNNPNEDSIESNNSNDSGSQDKLNSEDSPESKQFDEWNLDEFWKDFIDLEEKTLLSLEHSGIEYDSWKDFDELKFFNEQNVHNFRQDSIESNNSNEASLKDKSVSEDVTESNDSNEWNSDEFFKDSTELNNPNEDFIESNNSNDSGSKDKPTSEDSTESKQFDEWEDSIESHNSDNLLRRRRTTPSETIMPNDFHTGYINPWYSDYEENNTFEESQHTAINISETVAGFDYKEQINEQFSNGISKIFYGLNLFFLNCVLFLLYFLVNF